MTPGLDPGNGRTARLRDRGQRASSRSRPPQGVRYTRDGQFTASAPGILTDANGNPVLEPDAARRSKCRANGTRGRRARSASSKCPAPTKQGENLYTGTASGKAAGDVRQGALEGSGVDAAKVMVEMITSLRSFQSGQQAIQAIGQTLQQAATQVGSLNVG